MRNTLLLALAAAMAVAPLWAEDGFKLDYSATLTANAGNSELAPYYIASMRGGTVTQQYSALASVAAWHGMDTTRRFSYGFGLEAWAGYASKAHYDRWNAPQQAWDQHSQRPATQWIQQALAEAKYRALYYRLGAKQHRSPIVNNELSSGDMAFSGNTRPNFGVEAGFVNFQNVPFTHGWLQADGELAYYRPGTSQWLKHHYNYYNSFITTSYWLNYKRLHLRTNPNQPLVLTLGMQAACQFGGTTKTYRNGELQSETHMKVKLKTLLHTIFPGSDNQQGSPDVYYEGNHLGTWDIALDYKLPHGNAVRAYLQKPWEDGSGIGFLNGFDGLWGIEFKAGKQGLVNGVVLEYIDLTNQSGPIHFYSGDFKDGTRIDGQATGSDDYYNNVSYNGYQDHGMSIGSPFVKSPLYNRDGYMRFTDNMLRGFHLGLNGNLLSTLGYRVMVSWRKSWGTGYIPRVNSLSCTSLFVEGSYTGIKHLQLKAQLGIDRGKLYGNNAGGLISIAYHGNLSL